MRREHGGFLHAHGNIQTSWPLQGRDCLWLYICTAHDVRKARSTFKMLNLGCMLCWVDREGKKEGTECLLWHAAGYVRDNQLQRLTFQAPIWNFTGQSQRHDLYTSCQCKCSIFRGGSLPNACGKKFDILYQGTEELMLWACAKSISSVHQQKYGKFKQALSSLSAHQLLHPIRTQKNMIPTMERRVNDKAIEFDIVTSGHLYCQHWPCIYHKSSTLGIVSPHKIFEAMPHFTDILEYSQCLPRCALTACM